MANNPRLVEVGTTSGTPVNADVTTIGSDVAVAVLLTADYVMLDPPGFPFRPSFTGASAPQYPRTVADGTTLHLLACEASALVTAGGGTYA